MNNPYLIQLETLVQCNAKCTICGMRRMTRQHGKMSWSMFQKIIQDAKEFPIQQVVPFINGEPLLDIRMLDVLSYIKEELPNVEIGWFTNGQLLTKDILIDMAKIGNVKTFNISIHGGDKETYERVMDLSWDTLIEKLNLLVTTNKELSYPFIIKAQMCNFSLTKESISNFQKLCQDRGVEPCICGFSNFGGLIKDSYGESLMQNYHNTICQRSQFHLYVLYNGDVVPCCFDVNAVNKFGNVGEHSLREIWESDAHKRFRQLQRDNKQGELNLCNQCNSYKFNG